MGTRIVNSGVEDGRLRRRKGQGGVCVLSGQKTEYMKQLT